MTSTTPPPPAPSTPPVLEAAHLSFSYGERAVVNDVSFAIAPGEFVALVGPNGAGKSTLLRLLLGLLEPTAGDVRLFGTAPAALKDRWRLGYVPQRMAVPSDLPATVDEVVASGRLARSGWRRRFNDEDRGAIDHALTAVSVEHLRDRPVRELSGGQQQRTFIAKAFAGQPELLVLDEPVAGVDAESQQRFRESLVHLVRMDRAAVLLVSHELGAVADELDRIIVLRGGRIFFDGPPADLMARGVSLGVHAEDLPLWLEDLPE